MAVVKINGFTAPYRSKTFQDQAHQMIQSSGVLRMEGVVSTVGPTITVPAFDFVQNGLLVSVTNARSVSTPSLEAPYFLTVSTATSAQVDDLVFQFARSPSDLSSEQVIVAYWDGLEWRKPQQLSIKSLYEDVNQENLDLDRVGPVSGLLTSVAGLNYETTGGILVDRQGLRQTLQETFSTPTVVDDADFDRVDRIVYRRAQDSENRIGRRQFVLGGAYATTPTGAHQTTFIPDTFLHTRTKVLIGSDNTVHFLTTRGYSGDYSLVYSKWSGNRTVELVAPTVLFTLDSEQFSCCIDSSNNIHVVYIHNGDLLWRKFNSVGAAADGPDLLHNPATTLANPVCEVGRPQGTERLYVVYQNALGPSSNRIYLTSIEVSNGTVSLSPKELSLGTGNLINPDLFVTDDLDLYVVVEESVTSRVSFRSFDDIGEPLADAVVVSSATEQIGVGTLSGGAKNPRILVSDNKVPFVVFLQDKGALSYGLAVWSAGSAFMQELLSPSENFSAFDVAIDDVLNGLHLALVGTSSAHYVKLEGTVVQFTYQITAQKPRGIATARDKTGAMLHSWTHPWSGTYTDYVTGVTVPYYGAMTVTGGLGNYPLLSDELLIVTGAADPAVGDRITLSGTAGATNDGSRLIVAVTPASINSSGDYLKIKVDSAFTGSEVTPPGGVAAAFADPDGTEAEFVKTNSELTSKAFRYDVLPTDLLLARISLPGPLVLNYGTATTGPVPAPTDKLIPYGAGVEIDWEATSAGTLTLDGGFKILDLVNGLVYSLADGSYAMSEDDALYVKLDVVTLSVTPLVTPIATLPFAEPIQVLGVIKQNAFVPHPVLSSVGVEEISSGETVVIGGDLPDDIRGRLGIINDTSFVPYTSTEIIDANDNYALALSKLDQTVDQILEDRAEEETVTVGAAGSVFQFPTLTWDGSNLVYDIQVYINGKKAYQGLHFTKTAVNELTFGFTVQAGAEINVRMERTGGGAAGFFQAEDEGVLVAAVAQVLNFTGAGVSATNGGSGRVNVAIPGGPAASQRLVKNYKNTSGTTIPAGKAVSFRSDGGIELADANLATMADFAGVTLDSITDGNFGDVCKLGDCPGVISSLSAAPGQLIYLGENPGELSLTPPPLLTDTILIVGRAEAPHATNPVGLAPDLYITPQIISG